MLPGIAFVEKPSMRINLLGRFDIMEYKIATNRYGLNKNVNRSFDKVIFNLQFYRNGVREV